jgi:hypothetical protein
MRSISDTRVSCNESWRNIRYVEQATPTLSTNHAQLCKPQVTFEER